ncbi:MAG TPA: hypothetical protein VKR31_00020 [Rhizomicrobium sp.]|nr:hypothetical protein [Rhizomicrobium sp.]
MFSNPSHYPGTEPDEFGFPVSETHAESADIPGANSAEEVVGEIGLVLVVILGIVVALNVMLGALHIA